MSAIFDKLPSVPPRKKKQTVVERSVHFYRADAGSKHGKPIALDLAPTLEAVSKLAFDATTTRYWDQPNGDAIAVWTEGASWSRFSLATVRRVGLPRSEHKGKLASVPLAAGAGLHEPIHIVAFPDNIFGVEFNFYGPRPSRLPIYLQHAAPGQAPVFVLEPLLRHNVAAQLKKQKELRLLDLQVRSSYAATLAESKSRLGRALRAAATASEAEVVGLVLRPEPRGRTPLSTDVLEFANSVASRDDLQENATKFTVKGVNVETGRVDTLDLLEDRLVSKRQMIGVGGNSRAIKADSAYGAIEDAYEDLRDELELAASIGIAGAAS